MNILDNIKRIRQEKNITQADISEKLGLAQNNYGNIERGITELTLTRLYEIAKILDVSVLELLGESETTGVNKVQAERIQELEKLYFEEREKKERLKYEISTFLVILSQTMKENKYFKILRSMLPKTSEFLELIDETERKVREDF